jgi:hypothetical protein
MSEVRCPSCHIHVEPKPPKAAWKVACTLFWIGALLTATTFALLIVLNIVLVPMWLGIGAAVGVSTARARAWTCPVCHTEVSPPEEAREAEGHGLIPHPA